MSDVAVSSAASSNAAGTSEKSFFGKKLTKCQNVTTCIRRVLAVMLVVVLVTAGTIFWRSPSSATPVPLPPIENQPLEVSTLKAEFVQSYTRDRHYTGLLKESRRSTLSFQRGGEVVEIFVDEGQSVEAGQVLAQLDDRHIRAGGAQLTAQVEEAKARLEELLAGPRKETIAAKQAELRAQQSQSQILEKQLARREQLLKTTAVTREEYETVLYDFEAAEARVDVIQRQLDELLAGTRVEKIAAQRAVLSQLDAQLTDLSHDLQDTKLVAPFAGRISRRLIDEGAVLSIGSPVVELLDDNHLEAWIGLPPNAARTLNVGEKHTLRVDGEDVPAVVQSLAPDVNQATRTRNAIFRIEPSGAVVLPGQVARFAIAEQVAQEGFWVPTTALSRGTRGLWSLFVAEEGTVVRREVELLDTVGPNSFVRGTLSPNDKIITSGTHRVVVGQKVSAQSRL